MEDEWRKGQGEEEMRMELGRRQSSFTDGGRSAVGVPPVFQTRPRVEDEDVRAEAELAEIEGQSIGRPDGSVFSNRGKSAGVGVLGISAARALPLHPTIKPKMLGTF